MTPKFMLTLAACYLGLVGLGLLLAPGFMVLGLPADPSPVLMAQLRAMSDVFLGVAVLDWAARSAEAGKALNAIFLGNTVGFSLSVALGLSVSLTGGFAVSWVFTALSLFCAIGFIVAPRANVSSAG